MHYCLKISNIIKDCVFLPSLQAWLKEFNDGQQRRDGFAFALGFLENILGNIGAVIKYRNSITHTSTGISLAVLFITATFVQHIYLGMMLLKRRDWLLGRRDHSFVISNILKIAGYYYIVMKTPLNLIMQPLSLPNSKRGAALHLVYLPLLLARTGINFMTPIKAWSIITFAGNIVIVLNTITRCPDELAALPEQGHRYQEIAIGIERVLYGWLALPPIRAGKYASLLASGLSDVGACVTVRSWFQVRIR